MIAKIKIVVVIVLLSAFLVGWTDSQRQQANEQPTQAKPHQVLVMTSSVANSSPLSASMPIQPYLSHDHLVNAAAK